MTDPTTAEKIKTLRNAGLPEDAICVILELDRESVHEVSQDPSLPVTAGGTAPLVWKDWPMGNGWISGAGGGFGKPQYAIAGDLVYTQGAVNGSGASGPFPQIPSEARPLKRQRLVLNSSQAATSMDMDVDGVLKLGGGGVPPSGFTTLSGFYVRT